MSKRKWPATQAYRVLAALLRIGWVEVRTKGSHHHLERPGWQPYVFSFHEGVEVGPRILAKIGKATGLEPEDL